jgi:hypothetical protein
MATNFRYIGLYVKSDGKVDVRVPQSDGTWLEFKGVVPNLTILEVTDDRAVRALEYAVDPMGMFLYERVN